MTEEEMDKIVERESRSKLVKRCKWDLLEKLKNIYQIKNKNQREKKKKRKMGEINKKFFLKLQEIYPENLNVFQFDPNKKYVIFIDATRIDMSIFYDYNIEIDGIIIPAVGPLRDDPVRIYEKVMQESEKRGEKE